MVFEQPEAKWREIGTLQRRTIEAGVIARIYREMFAELGDEKA